MLMAIATLAVLPEIHLQERSARADWYASAGLDVGGQRCDEPVARIEEKLGVQIPRFLYVRVNSPEDVLLVTGTYASGIATGYPPTIISTAPCSKHEIAHLAMLQIGHVEGFFQEGFASMVGRDFDWVERWNIKYSARYIGESYGSANEYLAHHSGGSVHRRGRYILADAWMRHLVKHRGGMPAVIAFFKASQRMGDTRSAFLEVYGTQLDAEFDRWLYGVREPLQ